MAKLLGLEVRTVVSVPDRRSAAGEDENHSLLSVFIDFLSTCLCPFKVKSGSLF